MALCQECLKRSTCKEICDALNKEITGRGKTSSRKRRTYLVDFSYIEDSCKTLNSFQREVLSSLKKITLRENDRLFDALEIEEAISECLNDIEKDVLLFFIQNYKQQEIAQKLSISQQRVNYLLKRAFKKLRNFFQGSYKTPQNCTLPMEGGKGSDEK